MSADDGRATSVFTIQAFQQVAVMGKKSQLCCINLSPSWFWSQKASVYETVSSSQGPNPLLNTSYRALWLIVQPSYFVWRILLDIVGLVNWSFQILYIEHY